jgi:hypothetical protein
LNSREFIDKIDADIFEDIRCKTIYNLLATGFKEDNILNSLSKEDADWFSDLSFRFTASPYYQNNVATKDEGGDYNALASENFDIILRDLKKSKLRAKALSLQGQVEAMLEGKIGIDQNMIKEYNKLLGLLKGTRR